MQTVIERFLRYVKIDTRSDHHVESHPSTSKQVDLSRLLVQELKELFPAVAQRHDISEFTQDLLQGVPEDGFIISHQYPRFRHGEVLFLTVSW